MLESGSSGSVRGVLSNERPYREPGPKADMRPDNSVCSGEQDLCDDATRVAVFVARTGGSSRNAMVAALPLRS
jgi:hypothetical protein